MIRLANAHALRLLLGSVAALAGTLVIDAAYAGVLGTHSLVIATPLEGRSPVVSIESDGPADTGMLFEAYPPQFGSISGTARAFSSLDAGHLLGSATSGNFASTVFGPRGSGASSAHWRDIAFVSGEFRPPSVTLHFRVEGSLRSSNSGAQAYLSVSYQDRVQDTFHRDVAEGGAQILFGNYSVYGGDFFDAVESIVVAGGVDFMGEFSFDAPYDASLGGYDWGVRLSSRSDAMANHLGPSPFASMSEVSSLRSLSLLQVTDPAGNPLPVTFDSGLTFSSTAAVPEASTATLWLIAATFILGVAATRHIHQRKRAGCSVD